MRRLIRNATIGLAIGLAACNSDGMTGTDGDPLQVDHDVAVVAADAVGQDIELMGGPAGTLGIGLAPVVERNALHCESHTRGGLTVTRTCVFKDAAGNVQQAYDPNTTASVAIHAVIDGEVSHDRWSATVHRVRDLVVSGLAGDETTRTWNGTGSSSVSRSRHADGNAARTYDVTGDLTVTNVVIPAPRTDDSWPLSGTITKHFTIKVTGGPRDGQTHERTVTVTFNGTRLVPIVVNGETFTLDLKTRRIDK